MVRMNKFIYIGLGFLLFILFSDFITFLEKDTNLNYKIIDTIYGWLIHPTLFYWKFYGY
jgi:hypothetical protein